MTPRQLVRKSGITSMRELSEITGVSYQTLRNWIKFKPVLFEVVCIGAYESLHKMDVVEDSICTYCMRPEDGHKEDCPR